MDEKKKQASGPVKWILIGISVIFLFVMLVLPLVVVVTQALSKGWQCYVQTVTDEYTLKALTSHLGTHCECPYHHFEDGKSVGELPLTTFMGRAIYVNIDFLEPNSHISGADLDRACGDRIQEGDIVILDSNWKFPPFTPETNSPADKRLFVNAETANWMRDHKVKCVGFGDGVA